MQGGILPLNGIKSSTLGTYGPDLGPRALSLSCSNQERSKIKTNTERAMPRPP